MSVVDGDEFFDGLVDGSAGDSAVIEPEADEGEADIGQPCGEGWVDDVGFSKGEGDAVKEEHDDGEDDGEEELGIEMTTSTTLSDMS